MKPVNFKHQNAEFAKNQPEYGTLPALRIDSPEGEVISCWKLSFKERLRVLFLGKVWMSLMSFNRPLTPSYLSVNRKEVYSHPDDTIDWWKRYLNQRKIRLYKSKYDSLKLKNWLLRFEYSKNVQGWFFTRNYIENEKQCEFLLEKAEINYLFTKEEFYQGCIELRKGRVGKDLLETYLELLGKMSLTGIQAYIAGIKLREALIESSR